MSCWCLTPQHTQLSGWWLDDNERGPLTEAHNEHEKNVLHRFPTGLRPNNFKRSVLYDNCWSSPHSCEANRARTYRRMQELPQLPRPSAVGWTPFGASQWQRPFLVKQAWKSTAQSQEKTKKSSNNSNKSPWAHLLNRDRNGQQETWDRNVYSQLLPWRTRETQAPSKEEQGRETAQHSGTWKRCRTFTHNLTRKKIKNKKIWGPPQL